MSSGKEEEDAQQRSLRGRLEGNQVPWKPSGKGVSRSRGPPTTTSPADRPRLSRHHWVWWDAGQAGASTQRAQRAERSAQNVFKRKRGRGSRTWDHTTLLRGLLQREQRNRAMTELCILERISVFPGVSNWFSFFCAFFAFIASFTVASTGRGYSI